MKTSSKKRLLNGNYKFLFIVLMALLLAFMVNTFVVVNVRIVGASMNPLLHENDWIIANRLAYTNSEPAFGDVILFIKKDVTNETIVKRIIGIQGDTVEILNGTLLINDKPVTKDFAELSPKDNMNKVTVEENSYFVLGDNRLVSNDSRFWENPFVKFDEILGKVQLMYYPRIEKIV